LLSILNHDNNYTIDITIAQEIHIETKESNKQSSYLFILETIYTINNTTDKHDRIYIDDLHINYNANRSNTYQKQT
jgi:hypothetical protein